MRFQIVHCSQLAHGLAYPRYDQVTEHFVRYAVEANAVVDRVQYHLWGIHEYRVDVGKRLLGILQLELLDIIAS